MDKKQVSSSENGELHKLLWRRIEELEKAPQQKNEDERRADEAHRKATSEVMALVSSTHTPTEVKLKNLQSKLLQGVNEMRTLAYEIGNERRLRRSAEHDADSMKVELNRAKSAKSKLEALSRELSRQNRELSEQTGKKIAEEGALKEKLLGQLRETMTETERNAELQVKADERHAEEVRLLKEQLKDLDTRYDVREEHFGLQLRTKDLELELAEARAREQGASTEELKAKVAHLEALTKTQGKTETNLRKQLTEYGNKFDSFQETLDQNNQVFSAYTVEMEKMSKTVKQLQKANASLREENTNLNKKSNAAMYQLVSIKADLEDAVKAEKREKEKRDKLEKLCRSLTSERASLQNESDALHRAWHALKNKIDALRDEDFQTDHLWELIQGLVLEGEKEATNSVLGGKSRAKVDTKTTESVSR